MSAATDLATLRYQAAWRALAQYPTVKDELDGLPMTLHTMGLAPTVALLLRRPGPGAQIAEAIATWLLRDHPAPLATPKADSTPRAPSVPKADRPPIPPRELLRVLLEASDPLTVAALTDESIEYAAALKLLAR